MKFVDQEERQWNLEIKVRHVIKFKEEFGIDFIGDEVVNTVTRLLQEPLTRINLIWLIVKEQAESKSITEHDFYDSLGSKELKTATDCLMESVVNFIVAQRPDLDSVIAGITSKHGLLLKKQVELQQQMMEDPALEKKLNQLADQVKEKMQTELGKLSIDSLDPLDETLNPARFGN